MKRIPLTKGQYALVDDIDYQDVSRFNWCIAKSGSRLYASRKRSRKFPGKRLTLYLHRHIMGEPVGLMVDHINHDTLDNRRENLRVCTQTQNLQNRSGAMGRSKTGLRGVCFDRARNKFLAQISVNGNRINLGRFKTAEEAKAVYDYANRKHFGEFGGVL